MLCKVCECHGSSEMTIMIGCPMSQQVWHAEEVSLLKGHECRIQIQTCSPSSVTVTFDEYKRLTDHIAHIRNQFKSVNTSEQSYDNIYYKFTPLVQEERFFKYRECNFTMLLLSLLGKRRKEWPFNFKLKSFIPRMPIAKFG